MLALLMVAWDVSAFGSAETDFSGPAPETFGEKADRVHASIYDFLQRQVEHVDHWFVRKGKEALPVPPFELRLGLYGQAELDATNTLILKMPIDFDAKVHLPNLDRSLKLKVTTRDPTLIPGASPLEEERAPRIGVERGWTKDFHATLGLKTSFHPRLYSHLDWSPTWTAGNWRFYPFERAYWDSGDGLGEITSFMADRWRQSWNFRTAASLKWSAQKRDSDRQADNEEKGWEWDANIGVYHARELLRESDIGRVIAGADLARGVGVHFGVFGGPGHLDSGRLTVLHKGELWGRWLYYVIAPEIEWNRASNWRRTIILNFGVEMLFWHDRMRSPSRH